MPTTDKKKAEVVDVPNPLVKGEGTLVEEMADLKKKEVLKKLVSSIGVAPAKDAVSIGRAIRQGKRRLG
jgi:hypothetical protein